MATKTKTTARNKKLDRAQKVYDQMQDVKTRTKKRKFSLAESGVEFHDDYGEKKIHIPQGMKLRDVINIVEDVMTDWETVVTIRHGIDCFPLDGARALRMALQEIYGWAKAVPERSWFGSNPPAVIEMNTGYKQTEQVIWGQFELPNIGALIQTSFDTDTQDGMPRFLLHAKVQKQYEPIIRELAEVVERIVREESVYRGAALKMDFGWLMDGEQFNPDKHQPEFFDPQVEEDELIFNRPEYTELRNEVYARIERPDDVRKLGNSIRHGTLMAGDYGVGKTLAGLVIATKAVRNGMSFLYLKKAEQFEHGYNFIKSLLPGVLFIEDVNVLFSGERSAKMDRLLNILDGVDTKGDELICVFTTNDIESMNPASFRAGGRIDSFIQVELPDEESVKRFVDMYGVGGDGKSMLEPDADFTEAYKAMAGLPPAYISTAVKKAKSATIYTESGLISPVELKASAEIMWHHFNVTKGNEGFVVPIGEQFIGEIAERVRPDVDQDNVKVAQRIVNTMGYGRLE